MIQNKNSFDRKKKDLENKNEEMRLEMERQQSISNEIKNELLVFEDRMIEFEEKEAEHIKTVFSGLTLDL